MLEGKKILLGVSGSISAYKAALIVRLLVKQKAEVKVVLTPSAHQFVTELTLSTLSKNKVVTQFVNESEGLWNNHVEMGLWADVFLIAPTSANTLAKCANGICDNLLIATYLSARCPVFFAPAMDHDMWQNPSTQANIKKLESFGNTIIAPESGELASGLIGEGRLPEPETLVEILSNHFSQNLPLKGKKVLVTAGPTYEQIDPVRFIGNNSSGKMGIAIATKAQQLGADVHLILGPSHIKPPNNISTTYVKSAAQMLDATQKNFKSANWCIMAAAVADYTPAFTANKKIKKKDNLFTIELKKTTDILATLGKQKTYKQVLIGFALETNNEIEHAKSKLQKKNLDFIVLNSLKDKGAGFGHDTNKITILDKNGNQKSFELKTKAQVATDIIEYALKFDVNPKK